MFISKKYILQFFFLISFFSLSSISFEISAQKKFTVVIDAGHGGKDPGARGKISNEKDINLSVALLLGGKIEAQHPDVNVLYTRKKDVYLTVAERPKYANDVHADLFISIHTNASKSTAASGAETFTLGVAKTQENLEVAMLENSVILLEDNYEQKYQGFDPNSVESYIMFEFMQDKYLEQSIQLASLVQNQFTGHCKRKDRGVRQAGFLVLKNTAMPSILVELGFITNGSEEKYLSSKTGQGELSVAIYNAFSNFKREYDKKSAAANNANNAQKTTVVENNTAVENVENTEKTPSETNSQTIYKVQIFASKDKLKSTDSRFKGLKNINHYIENNIYKYTYGESTDYVEILKYQNEAKRYFPEAFVVSFVNGKRVK